MAEHEREQRRREQTVKAFYQSASSEHGFTLQLKEDDVLSMRVAGREITLYIQPQPVGAEIAVEDPIAPVAGIEDADSLARSPAEPASRTAAEREARRIRFSGRLASDPSYAPLPQRGLRVSFVVAQHLEDGTTVFHRSYATGDYARRIQQKNPAKGEEVAIDGERQVNRIRQADGSFKESPLVYCYGLRVKVLPKRAG
jgi:hypothetical protein